MTWEIETVNTLNDSDLFTEINNIGWNNFFWDEIIDINDPAYTQYQDNISSYTVPAGATSFNDIQFDATVKPAPIWLDVKAKFLDYVNSIHLDQMLAADITGTLFKIDPTLTKTLIRKTWVESEIEPTKPLWSTVWSIDFKIKAVATAYKTMSENIAEQVFLVFLTKDEISASAFAQSWRMKRDYAADYTLEGLTAKEAIAGFIVGDLLDTQLKIETYYTEKVNQLIAFDKFRDNEIKTYLVVKATNGL
jgi:hypothetical protein